MNFRNRGDPGLLLRCINPQEAALVQDRSSGAIVRFRLGGSIFPPVVYYKIFLRSAVTDIGAFAPRDYTVSKPTQYYLLNTHNQACRDSVREEKVREVTQEVDTSLWYHRFENNGWRPIANKHLHSRDNVTLSTAERRQPDFHHMSQTRKIKQLQKRQMLKEKWMARMYKPEGQGDQTQNPDTIKEYEDDEELEDMEEWARHLDFDSYFSDWLSLATSVSTIQLAAESMSPP